ncbi:MAG: ureidoglycolate lyase [Hyphomicrobiales bacterium]
MRPEALNVEPLNREGFRRFGDVIETEGAHSFPINNGTTERYHALAAADVDTSGGKAILSIFEGVSFSAPIAITMMERHPLGSQAFMPLSGEPYLVVVAEDDGAGKAVRPCAFLAGPGQGVNYTRGTWHHPLLSLNKQSRFLVVDREGDGENLEEFDYPAPGFVIEKLPSMNI